MTDRSPDERWQSMPLGACYLARIDDPDNYRWALWRKDEQDGLEGDSLLVAFTKFVEPEGGRFVDGSENWAPDVRFYEITEAEAERCIWAAHHLPDEAAWRRFAAKVAATVEEVT